MASAAGDVVVGSLEQHREFVTCGALVGELEHRTQPRDAEKCVLLHIGVIRLCRDLKQHLAHGIQVLINQFLGVVVVEREVAERLQ